MSRMTMRALIASASLLGTFGCANEPPQAPPDDIQTPSPSARAVWGEVATDPIVRAMIHLPTALPRFLTRLRIEATDAKIASVTLLPRPGDANSATRPLAAESCVRSLLWADETMGACAVLALEPADLQPGDQLRVTARAKDGATLTLDVSAPSAPADESLQHYANVAAATADGTIWSGSPIAGLVGLTADGELVVMRGADLLELEMERGTLAHRGPLSNDVVALAPTPDRGGLWIGATIAGVSYFEPGTDPTSVADDLWMHLPARGGVGGALEDPRHAPRAIVSDGLAGAWVATENGLLHVGRAAAQGAEVPVLAAQSILDGAFESVAVAADGTVWAGAVEADGSARGLVRLDSQGSLDDWTDDQVTMGLREIGVVHAIVASDHGVWLGATHGLYRLDAAEMASGRLVAVAMNAAIGLPDGYTVVRLATSPEGALWLAARPDCTNGLGRLLRVSSTNDDDVTAVDHSDRGFGERDFNDIQVLDDGRVLVSTLVTRHVVGDVCGTEHPVRTSADLYVIDATAGGPIARLGRP